MTNHLEEDLKASLADLTLDRPVDQVIARGQQMRRRRARRGAFGAVAAASVGAAVLSVTLPGGESPLVTAASAAWGPELVSMQSDDLGAAVRTCHDMQQESGWTIPSGLDPVVADLRGDTSVVVYADGDDVASCYAQRHNGRFLPSGASLGTRQEMPAGANLELVSLSGASGTVDGPVRDGAAVFEVSDAVERVDVTVDGQTVHALVDDGFAALWLPDGIAQSAIDHATVTAYDRSGNVLVDDTVM